MGLLAQLLAAVWQRADWVPSSRIGRMPLQVASWILIVIHLVVAPLALANTTNTLKTFNTIIDRAAASLPSDSMVADQVVIIVNSPTAFISIYGPLLQALDGRPTPSRTLILGSGIYPTTISRPAANRIAIRPAGGYLVEPGSSQPGHEATQPPFHPAYFFQMLDHLYRDATPMRVGDRIAYGGAWIEITDASEDGRPIEIEVLFEVDVEDSSLRWLQWRKGVYVPFETPAIGESAVLPEVILPMR
jgi:hypothetical protein